MKFLLFLFISLFSLCLFSQDKKVLIYHETNSFRHGSINNGITMITNQGNANGLWITDESQNSNVFTAQNLVQYDAVIFLNTSGTDESGNDGDLLSASEKAAFENFIINGGGFVGIHAATDTYRNGIWPFYNELVGGIVQANPFHTNNNFNATMTVENSHPAVDFLGSNWNKNEEYYYWEQNGGQLSTDNIVLLEVEETVGPNGMVNSYDAARPISWYKESITVNGTMFNNIRSFYTALGHNGNDYDNNTTFQNHIEEAIKWAIGETLSISNVEPTTTVSVFPNPAQNKLTIKLNQSLNNISLTIYNVLGKRVFQDIISTANNNSHNVDVSSLTSGIYILTITSDDFYKSIKIIKN